jgi:phytanoyl-CoA hydroxylase
MTLSSVDLAEQFSRDGYLIVPNLFTRDEAQQLKTEIQQILEGVRQEARAAGKDPNRAVRHGVFVGLAARSDLFKQAVQDPRLVEVLKAAIGPNVEFLSDKVVFKSHDEDFGTPWHQDWSYWYGSHKLSVWVALDDATEENGCLMLVPGSHRDARLHDGDSSDDKGFAHRIDTDAIDPETVVSAPIEAGGAIVFHDLTLHASHQNRSGRDRWVWIPTYRDAQAEDPEYSWAVAATVVAGTRER